VRKLGIALGAAILAGGAPLASAQQDAGAAPRAVMTCERASAPGRVRCDVEARVGAGESIAWGDVVIERTPAFADALRGRIGPHDATVREPQLWRWGLALVAREAGAGEVLARVRLVVCQGARCTGTDVSVVGRVVAGAGE
jgi:hypothetical protein